MRYAIYIIVGPTGRLYVGLSINPDARWASHRRRARENNRGRHPFYDALRKYGSDAFTLHVLEWHDSLDAAKNAEVQTIAAFGASAYNISPGGEYDAEAGGKIFWERMRQDPEAYAAYIERLSAGVKAVAHTFDRKKIYAGYLALPARYRWKHQHRMTRLSLKTRSGPIVYGACVRLTPKTDAARNARRARLSALRQHARRGDDEKLSVNAKIAESLRATYADGTDAKQRLLEMGARGRANMDRKVQGAAASKGLKEYWANLKKDPVAYAAHIQRRKETLMRTLERKKNENI